MCGDVKTEMTLQYEVTVNILDFKTTKEVYNSLNQLLYDLIDYTHLTHPSLLTVRLMH